MDLLTFIYYFFHLKLIKNPKIAGIIPRKNIEIKEVSTIISGFIPNFDIKNIRDNSLIPNPAIDIGSKPIIVPNGNTEINIK